MDRLTACGTQHKLILHRDEAGALAILAGNETLITRDAILSSAAALTTASRANFIDHLTGEFAKYLFADGLIDIGKVVAIFHRHA